MEENEEFGKLWKIHLFADSETRSQEIPYIRIYIQYDAVSLAKHADYNPSIFKLILFIYLESIQKTRRKKKR